MSHARQAGLSLQVQTEQLVLLARASGESDTSIIEFVRTLTAFLIRADGCTGAEEILLQSAYNKDDGHSWTEEAEYARQRVRNHPRFLRTVPAFLLAAKDYDDIYGTRTAAGIVHCIAEMCATISSVDGQYHVDERETGAVLIATMNSAIDRDSDPWRAI